jgi:phage head maturation protease
MILNETPARPGIDRQDPDESKKHFCVTTKAAKRRNDGGFDWVLTRKEVDRDGDVIIPEGMKLPANAKKDNIPVLWLHGYDARGFVPIGTLPIEKIKITKNQVTGTVYFDDENDGFAAMIADKVARDVLDSGSIGFRVLPGGWSREADQQGQTGFTIKDYELLEFSIVPVPANASALRKDVDTLAKSFEFLKDYFDRDVWPMKKSRVFDVAEAVGRTHNLMTRIKGAVDSSEVELTNDHIRLIELTFRNAKAIVGDKLSDQVDPQKSNEQDSPDNYEKTVELLGNSINVLTGAVAKLN